MNTPETASTGRANTDAGVAQRLTEVVFYLVLTLTWTSYLIVLVLRSSRSVPHASTRPIEHATGQGRWLPGAEADLHAHDAARCV